MPDKNDKNSSEKHPLDMTTDEAIEHLFGPEGAKELKEHVNNPSQPQPAERSGLKGGGKSSRRQDSR
jgi:hypothetical protein